MRKLFTFLLTMVVAMVANAAIPPTIQLGDEFTSVAALDGKTFAIVDKAAEKALFGSNNQNLAFDAYGSAFVTTNSGYTWQLESLAENADESVHGYYLLHLVAPNGTPVPTSDWGGKYLNSQDKGGWCCFNLGITAKKLGQDIDYGAVWDVQFVEGKGFSLKNIGTGLYKGADGGTANKEEAAYFAFAPVSITYVPALKALLAEGEAMKKRGASSAAYDAAIEGIDPDKSEDALADAQKVEAALPALAKTQLTAGSDFTRAIANFDCGAKDGWTFEKPKGGNGPDHGGDFEYWAGNASDRATASFDYWQEITGLPNGTYTVSAEMYNSLNNEGGDYTEFKPTVGVYATVGEKTVSKLVDVNSETRVPYVTDAIEVTDGKIRIGAKSFEAPMAARWFTVDNFKLTLVKPAVAPTAPEKDKWFNEIDFCFRDKASTVATSTEKTFAVWGADPDDVTNGCIVATAGKNSSATNAQFWIRGAEYVEPTYIGKDKAQLTAVYDKGGFAAKTGFKVTMRVKADGEYSAGSQTHKAFQHVSNDGFGTLNVTKEWQTVTFVCIADDARAGFTDLCFNLAASDADRTFYFDDVKIEGRGGSEWYLNNEFHAKDYKDPAVKYTDGNDPHPVARFVSDAEGGYVEVISNAGGDQPYNSQLWIAIPAEYVGKSTKMTMEVQASKAIKTPESFQATATGNGWGCNPGPGAGLEFSVGKWTTITRILKTEGVKSTGTWKDLQADQYCLDLTEKLDGNAGEAITYKFRNVKFEQAAEDWYEQNVIVAKDPAVDYEDGKEYEFPAAPYVFGTGEEGGYIEVKSKANPANEWASQIFFEIPTALRNGQVELVMTVKASKAVKANGQLHKSNNGGGYTNAAAPAAEFTTDWNEISLIIDPTTQEGLSNYVLNIALDAEGVTYDFDKVAFKKYVAPVDPSSYEEWYTALGEQGVALVTRGEVGRDGDQAPIYTKGTGEEGDYLEVAAKTSGDRYATQFFVKLSDEVLAEGTKVKVTMNVKASEAVKVGTQAQNGVGNYAGWNTFGEYEFTTDWKEWAIDYTVPNGMNLNTIALDLCYSSSAEARSFFFDNIKVELVEPVDPTTLDWAEQNILENGDLKSNDMSEFVLKNNDVENPEMLLAEKSAIGDGFEIGIETAARPTNEDGSVGGNDYDAQFFVRLPSVLPKGSMFNLEFDVYAEEVNTLAIQAHNEPGQWKANLSSVKTDPSGEGVVHYQEYLTAPEDMRSIAINLAVATKATYGFSNFSVKTLKDDEAAIKAATDAANATTLWAETLALNEACYAGRTTETEGKGYSEDLVQALTDAIAAGKAELKKDAAEVTAESLTAAAKAITDAIAALAPKEAKVADLTADMYHKWTGVDGSAAIADPDDANCDYVLDSETGCAYGNSNINIGTSTQYADLGEWDYLTIVVASDNPRLFFNQNDVADQGGNILVPVTDANYVVSNENGVIVYDLAKFKADKGFVHLNAIKASAYNTQVNITEMKLATVEPYKPVANAIEGVENAEDAVKDEWSDRYREERCEVQRSRCCNQVIRQN